MVLVMERIIMHIDFDSFYASLERARNASLHGKPLIICMYSARSGAVATASYEARALGIRSGMPLSVAKSRSNAETVFLPADRDYYQQVSVKVMDLLREKAPFQQTSIDEAYLDVTFLESIEKAVEFSNLLKKEIEKEFNITCSIGVGPNKFISKLASDYRKPNGLTIVLEKDIDSFLGSLELRKLHGIGPKTIRALEEMGVATVVDLRKQPLLSLQQRFGENKGRLIYEKAHGIDESIVEEQERKQFSRIQTLSQNTNNIEEIMFIVEKMCDDIDKKITEKAVAFRTIHIIAVLPDLEIKTRSMTLEQNEKSALNLLALFKNLFIGFFKDNGVLLRRCGIGVSNFSTDNDFPYQKKHRSLSDF